jgi:hypothetical protein
MAMLIDKNGRIVRQEKLPKGGRAAQAVLANLREVPEPRKDKGGMFNLGQRAMLREKSK